MSMELDTISDSGSKQMDIDIQTTLFSKLRITRNRTMKHKKDKTKTQSIAECRIEKDMKEINESKWKSFGCNTTININTSHRFEFELTLNPIEGYYRNGIFSFIVFVNKNYPFSAPHVLCKSSIFHPNIDIDNKQIALHLLHVWSPVLSLNDLIVALQLLFFEPNCASTDKSSSNPSNYLFSKLRGNRYNNTYKKPLILNKCAANLYITNKQQFDDKVQRMINGRNYNDREWQYCSRSSNTQIFKQKKSDLYMKSNQIITKQANVLGHRKRRFSEMEMECFQDRNIGKRNTFLKDDIVFNPVAIRKKQKKHHVQYIADDDEDIDVRNNL